MSSRAAAPLVVRGSSKSPTLRSGGPGLQTRVPRAHRHRLRRLLPQTAREEVQVGHGGGVGEQAVVHAPPVGPPRRATGPWRAAPGGGPRSAGGPSRCPAPGSGTLVTRMSKSSRAAWATAGPPTRWPMDGTCSASRAAAPAPRSSPPPCSCPWRCAPPAAWPAGPRGRPAAGPDSRRGGWAVRGAPQGPGGHGDQHVADGAAHGLAHPVDVVEEGPGGGVPSDYGQVRSGYAALTAREDPPSWGGRASSDACGASANCLTRHIRTRCPPARGGAGRPEDGPAGGSDDTALPMAHEPAQPGTVSWDASRISASCAAFTRSTSGLTTLRS